MKHHRFYSVAVFVTIGFLSVCSGCGNYVPVAGKVTFSDDGSPLTRGTVVFDNGKENGMGMIREDGTYTVNFGKEGRGLPKGKWLVSIAGAETREESEVKDPLGNVIHSLVPKSITPLIDAKYALPTTSGLVFEADGKTNTFDIVVDRPAP